jgi:hypothetical protein
MGRSGSLVCGWEGDQGAKRTSDSLLALAGDVVDSGLLDDVVPTALPALLLPPSLPPQPANSTARRKGAAHARHAMNLDIRDSVFDLDEETRERIPAAAWP